MVAMTSFHTEKCCHLVSEHEASAVCLCSSVYQLVWFSSQVKFRKKHCCCFA